MNTKLRILLFVCVCAIPPLALASSDIFTRTLFSGMRGDDVTGLQKFLNTDAETRIADAGAGSPGNETDYFGNATKRAVIKFQEKYRAEILAPIGLTNGTGFFGEKTRAKVNSLASIAPVPVVTTPKKATTTPALPVEKGKVILMFPSVYSGKPGTIITLSGVGFTATDNTIYFGDTHAVEKAVSWNSRSITFKIPVIPKGNYSISVKNARGESDKKQFFVVTDGVTQEPKIESITPERVMRGGSATIKGTGFLPSGNTIRYGAGIINDVSSVDGTTLSFSVPVNILKASTSSLARTRKISLPVRAYVINENGVSNAKSYTLEI
ncbi:MAG: IPT/TIG domain-containing protein [Patescibacteria group bacterium]